MRSGKVIDIVQARMGSSRLPGKVMKPLCGKPMIEHLLNRLSRAERVDELWVATTTSPKDDELCAFLESRGFNLHRGPEDDVLTRYVETAEKSGAEVILRHTADCPLLDPELVDAITQAFLESDWDYMRPLHEDGMIRGLDTEIFTAAALNRADALAQDAPSREHVTLYMYRHPEAFSFGVFPMPERLKLPGTRLCVDEEDDFRLIEAIYNALYREGEIIPFSEVLELLKTNPALRELNKSVQQKHP
ncbi:MAG: NTP transferase domain-containing protein [Fretibacterium sp.]|nr:NTP transferase domain-containing protein [Fretibacterium sp.]